VQRFNAVLVGQVPHSTAGASIGAGSAILSDVSTQFGCEGAE